MKKGDIVTIRDSSYSVIVEKGELILLGTNHGRHHKREYMVVEIGCKFPLTELWQGKYGSSYNDTVIQALDNTNEVIFIEERFLQLMLTREVTMAEVCARFGEDIKIKKE